VRVKVRVRVRVRVKGVRVRVRVRVGAGHHALAAAGRVAGRRGSEPVLASSLP